MSNNINQLKLLSNKYKTGYADKSVCAAKARLLQSIWREEQGIPLKRTWGNYLSLTQAYCNQNNFLSQKIKDIVAKEVEANEQRKGKDKKVIKTDRLYENMLASQPLAFNLFSELKTGGFEIANKVFKKIFGDKIQNITSIEFEISPGRGDLKYTGDHSAFDVFIEYEGKGVKGCIGIEIKYAETLLDKPASFKDRYKDVAKLSNKFTDKGIEELCKMPMSQEQIWRDHLLSLSMTAPFNSDYSEGFFVYLFPKENIECEEALKKYYNKLYSLNANETGIHILHMNDFVAAIKESTSDKWIFDFEDRYLRFDKIDFLLNSPEY